MLLVLQVSDVRTYKKDWGVDLVDKAKPAARQGRKATGLPIR